MVRGDAFDANGKSGVGTLFAPTLNDERRI